MFSDRIQSLAHAILHPQTSRELLDRHQQLRLTLGILLCRISDSMLALRLVRLEQLAELFVEMLMDERLLGAGRLDRGQPVSLVEPVESLRVC